MGFGDGSGIGGENGDGSEKRIITS